jgi:hypothetical protein
MANTLTNLIPDIYAALDVVAREMVGYIPAVAKDTAADKVAVGQNLRVPQTVANAAGGDVTPAMALPSIANQTINNQVVTISKSRFWPFSWNGEEQYAINSGVGFLTLRQNQIAQALRAATNEIDLAINNAILAGASRAYGTAGTTPFATASDMSDLAQTRKILQDNGAPVGSDMHLVLNTTAGANLRGKMSNLFKMNESADASVLRQGNIVSLPLEGFNLHESAQAATHTKGTGSAYVFNGAHAIGATSIVVKTGSGTIVAGDVLTFQNDTNKYVVNTGVGAPGTLTINNPGLLVAHVDGETVTIANNYAQNSAFYRNAVVLATRLPMVPQDGDLALDHLEVTDPVSGLVFDFAAYPGYRMITYHVSIAYGVAVIKPEFVALLLG